MASTTEDEVPEGDPLGREGLPLKLSRLRWKLGQKAKREPKFRFYALYDRIYRPDVLRAAYHQVRRMDSAPGVDGVRFSDIESTEDGLDSFLTQLAEDLKTQRYQPHAVRRVYIPKADGRQRPLGIPTIRDRVVQMAVLLIVEPIFEADFLDTSYGFRPGRNAHQALDTIRDHIAQGKRTIYDADLQGYFDTIPHDKLMLALKRRIADGSVLRLFHLWLCSPIEERDEHGNARRTRPLAGTPQGGVISPLLANLYLHWFEVLFHRTDGPSHWAQARLVRYADDFVVLARYQSSRLHHWIEHTLEGRFGLTINRQKTRVVDLDAGDSLDFLGFTLRYERSILPGSRRYLHVGPSRKALQRIRDRLHELTGPRYCFFPAKMLVERVNLTLRGWMQYFAYGHPRRAFRHLDRFTQERISCHLQRRSQRGYRPPGRSLYEHMYHYLGLVRVTPAKPVCARR